MDQMIALTRRVYRLEQEVSRLKGSPLEAIPELLLAPAGTPAAATREVTRPLPEPPPAPATPAGRMRNGEALADQEPLAPTPGHRRSDVQLESELVGTWFARIGAIALIIGAGFGFKYGIDRGFIGPAARVATGIIAGLLMVWWGEWARRREWPRFAQAVTACGLGTMVLSIWAAYHLYEYLSAVAALSLLLVVTMLAVALAIRHDSEALAVLATIAAFIDPLLVGGRSEPAALYGYILVIDAGVVALAALRRWPSLNMLGAAFSWILFGLGAADATTGVALGYASAIFATFSAASLLTNEDESGGEWRALLAAANGIAYMAAGLALLREDHRQTLGAFASFVATAHVALGAALQRLRPNRNTQSVTAVMAMGFFTIAVGLQWQGLDAALAWAVEAAVLGVAGTLLGNRFLRGASIAVIGLSVGASVLVRHELGALYQPERLLVSKESLTFVTQIASAFILAATLRRGMQPWERQAAQGLLIGANVLAVMWLSFEAYGHYGTTASNTQRLARQPALQFALSAIWGLYAAALLAIGIAVRSRTTRLMSIALFGLTIIKMSLADLWTLTTGLRMLGFMGLGVVLLLTSLTYHRFRGLIFGIDQAPQTSNSEAMPPPA